MKKWLLLAFYVTVNFFTATQAMKPKNQLKVLSVDVNKEWIKTNKKEIISISHAEKGYSSSIKMLSNHLMTGDSKRNPTFIRMDKKDIRTYQDILHKPSLIHELSEKKYIHALTIAERLKSILLYAELLHDRLPATISALIAHQCLLLSYPLLCDQINAQLTRQPRSLNRTNKLTLYSVWNETAQKLLTDTLSTATLPQAALLMSTIHSSPYDNVSFILPHMPGYEAFTSWNDEQQMILRYTLPMKEIYIQTQLGNRTLRALLINEQTDQ